MASPKQTQLWRPPEVGFFFEEVNPDKVRDQNVLIGLPTFWPFPEACQQALAYIKGLPPVQSSAGKIFNILPPELNGSWEDYARHLVMTDGNEITTPTKLKGLRSIHTTLKHPSFCLHDDRPDNQTHLYCRVYKNGEIHVVVVDPENLRVKTQYLFADKNNSALLKMKIIGVRDDWR